MAVVAAALLAPLVVAQPAGAGPAISGTTGHIAAAADDPLVDRSMEMPRTRNNEVTGDFLGQGYDQRMIVENEMLNIYDAHSRGGALLRSTPTDLYTREASDKDFFSDQLLASATANSIRSIPLEWTPDALFMAGATDDGIVVYRLPPDGSCAQEHCAVWVQKGFQSRWGWGPYDGDFPNGEFHIRVVAEHARRGGGGRRNSARDRHDRVMHVFRRGRRDDHGRRYRTVSREVVLREPILS